MDDFRAMSDGEAIATAVSMQRSDSVRRAEFEATADAISSPPCP